MELAHKNLIPSKSLLRACLVSGALFLGGCAEVSLLGMAATEAPDAQDKERVAAIRSVQKVGKPYQVDNIWYYPQVDPGYNETGIASWYGEPFHGRKTANGETYDMNQLTAAHKTLPMPSNVRVTNLENGRSIVVTVNDRGPFVNGRIIDLSRRAAQLLGVIQKGTAKVRVEVVGQGQQPGKGNIKYLAKAETTPEERNAIAAPQKPVKSASLAPPTEAKVAPAQTMTVAKAQPADTSLGVTQQANTGAPVVVQTPVTPTEIFIQAGAFIDFNNANKLSARLSPMGAAKVYQVLVNGQDFYRVRLGPVYTVAEADDLLTKLLNGGFTNARIVIE